MTHLKGRDRAIYVQDMFARIAPRYDLMNRLMTFGRDSSWRREVIRRARLSAGNRLLDMGAGTGDLAREAIKQAPGCQVVAADFTVSMMQIGRTNHPESRLEWTAGDAGELPFPGQTLMPWFRDFYFAMYPTWNSVWLNNIACSNQEGE